MSSQVISISVSTKTQVTGDVVIEVLPDCVCNNLSRTQTGTWPGPLSNEGFPSAGTHAARQNAHFYFAREARTLITLSDGLCLGTAAGEASGSRRVLCVTVRPGGRIGTWQTLSSVR